MRTALAVATLLALASAGAVQATWAGLLAPAAPVSEAFGSATGVSPVGVLAGTVGEAPEPPAPPASEPLCSGTAPLTVSCALDFTAPAGATYALFANGGTGFTGTVAAVLTDASGNWVRWTCVYTAYVGGVSPVPSCSAAGSGTLHAGTLRLQGGVPDPAAGTVSVGFWEVGVKLG